MTTVASLSIMTKLQHDIFISSTIKIGNLNATAGMPQWDPAGLAHTALGWPCAEGQHWGQGTPPNNKKQELST